MIAAENRAFELVASALSDEYGVRVVCAGLRAQSRRDANGIPIITVPAIPIRDPNYRLLMRGYIDHEVGHIRFSDSKAIESGVLEHPEISGSIKAIASIFEDIGVDKLMGECFVGCRRNLRRLVQLLYGEGARELPDAAKLENDFEAYLLPTRELPWIIWRTMLQWLIRASRALAAPKLEPVAGQWREQLEIFSPGMPEKLEAILARLDGEGGESRRNLALAREAVDIIRQGFARKFDDEVRQKVWDTEINWILRNGGEERELADMGRYAVNLMDEMLQESEEDLEGQMDSMRHDIGSDVWQGRLRMLTEDERRESLRSSAKMAAQMQGLLQSFVLNREGPFRKGRLHTRSLHKLFIGRDDVFCRNAERRDINTEIAICVDMSGSMRFENKDVMASKSLYAVAESLAHIQGLNLYILGFFDNHILELHNPRMPLNPRMGIIPDGGTLCGVAVREAAQCFSASSRKRRLIIMITDGDANDPDNFKTAIEELRDGGLELLGVGIMDEHIKEYLPPEECIVINDLSQLAGGILGMLRKKLGIH